MAPFGLWCVPVCSRLGSESKGRGLLASLCPSEQRTNLLGSSYGATVPLLYRKNHTVSLAVVHYIIGVSNFFSLYLFCFTFSLIQIRIREKKYKITLHLYFFLEYARDLCIIALR
jgi:hypothetical protein